MDKWGKFQLHKAFQIFKLVFVKIFERFSKIGSNFGPTSFKRKFSISILHYHHLTIGKNSTPQRFSSILVSCRNF